MGSFEENIRNSLKDRLYKRKEFVTIDLLRQFYYECFMYVIFILTPEEGDKSWIGLAVTIICLPTGLLNHIIGLPRPRLC